MLYRRLFIPPLTTALVVLAILSADPVAAPGTEHVTVVAAVAGLLSAAAWRGNGWRLIGLACVAGAVLSLSLVTLVLRHAMAGPIQDGRLALFSLAFCVFSLSTFCGWLVFHEREPWPVAVLAAIAVLARANVSPWYESAFPLFVVGLLALIVFVYAANGRSLLRGLPATIAALALVALCWQLPAIRVSWSANFNNPVSTLIVGQSFSTFRQLSLTGAFHPSGLPLMIIKTSDPDAQPYWGSEIFDWYDGHAWSISSGVERSLGADSLLVPPLLMDTNRTTQTLVKVLEPTNTLVSPGTPVWVNVPTVASYTAAGVQPVEVRTSSLLQSGDEYKVDSVPMVDIPLDPSQQQLYLQLPNLPDRVRQLALSLTRNQIGDLSKVLAVRSFLRDSGEFKYDASVGSPTKGDAVDTFLFDSHRGYCTQFASALAILVREVGIPSRIVTGYAGGSQSPGGLLIRAADAHSWDQVYVGGEGWVTVDPTPPATSASARLGGLRNPIGGRANAKPPTRGHGQFITSKDRKVGARAAAIPGLDKSTSNMVLAAGGIFFICLCVFAYALRPRPVALLYASIARDASPSETPLEYAARRGYSGGVESDLGYLTNLYLAERYAGVKATPEEQHRAWRGWLRLLFARMKPFSRPRSNP